MNATIDFETIAAGVDLEKLLRSEGIEVVRGMAYCPFHANERTPALSVYRTGHRWRYRCHGCGASGDSIAWVAAREGIAPVEAARKLGGLGPGPAAARDPGSNRPAAEPAVKVERPAAFSDLAWQAAVGEVVDRAAEVLWSPEGSEARRWLRSRGLADRTIRGFRLGFVPRGYDTAPLEVLRKEDQPRAIFVARGIVLPWVAPGAWYSSGGSADGPQWVGANVRRLMPDVFEPMPAQRKCQALLGSARGFAYPHADVLATQGELPALIVEGEFDALLGHQEAGDLASVLTVGGASQSPHPSALEALEGCPNWLLALDHDDAGVKGALRWRGRAPEKCRRVLVPTGKDLGEFLQAGGDLRAWLAGELRRLGQPADHPIRALTHPSERVALPAISSNGAMTS